MKPDIIDQKGLTLIELMVAMAIAGIVAAAMFTFQQGQTRSYVTQEVVSNMQQNARAAMHFMTSEIRMAGCDPTGNANARILQASSDSIQFTMDFSSEPTVDDIQINFEGGVNPQYVLGVPDGSTEQRGEDITYSLDAAGNLMRTEHRNHIKALDPVVIAQNMDALDFVYLDEDGNRIGGLGDDLGLNDRGNIRAVQVTVLARSTTPGFSYRHTDTQSYTNQAGDPLITPNPANDSVRRIMLSTEIRLRNR